MRWRSQYIFWQDVLCPVRRGQPEGQRENDGLGSWRAVPFVLCDTRCGRGNKRYPPDSFDTHSNVGDMAAFELHCSNGRKAFGRCTSRAAAGVLLNTARIPSPTGKSVGSLIGPSFVELLHAGPLSRIVRFLSSPRAPDQADLEEIHIGAGIFANHRPSRRPAVLVHRHVARVGQLIAERHVEF